MGKKCPQVEIIELKEEVAKLRHELSVQKAVSEERLDRLVAYSQQRIKVKELKRVAQESEDGDTGYMGYFIPTKDYIDQL